MIRQLVNLRLSRLLVGAGIAAWIATIAPLATMAEDGDAPLRGRPSQRRLTPGGGLQRTGESDGAESRTGKTPKPGGSETEKTSSPKGGATLASCCSYASCGANSGGSCGCGSKCPGKPVSTSAPGSSSGTKSGPAQSQSPGPKVGLKSSICGSDCNCCAGGGAVFNQESLTLQVEQIQPADAAALLDEHALPGGVIEVGDTGGTDGATADVGKGYTYDQREERKKLLKSKRKELADLWEYVQKHENSAKSLDGIKLDKEIKDLEKEVGKLEAPGTPDEEAQKLENAKKQAEAAKEALADQQAKVDAAKNKLKEAEKKLEQSQKGGAQSIKDMENQTNAQHDIKKANKELAKANSKLDLKQKEFKQLEKEVADREQRIKDMEKAASK